MTVGEFSREFDILYNNIMSNAAPGIDDYEKSVFLTKALEEIVTAIYDGSFEDSERYRECLNALVTTIVYGAVDIIRTANNHVLFHNNNFDNALYAFPEDCMFIVYEHLYDKNTNNIITVVPTTHDAFFRLLKNPFKRPDKSKAFRLNVQAMDNNIVIDNALEIITYKNMPLNDCEYFIRYIRKPQPIILYNDPGGVSTNGKDTIIDSNNPCELHTMLHRIILEAAVKMASETYKQYN